MWPFKNKKSHISAEPDSPRFYGVVGGTPVTTETAMKVSAYYSGVIYLSTQIAKLPCHIKNKKNEIEDGDISTLLNVAPNPEMSAFHFKSFMVQQALNEGNGYAEIERDFSGRVKALWPLKSRSVQVTRFNDKDRTLAYRVVAGSPSQSGVDVILPARDIFHLPNFYTTDGIVGMGLTWYAQEVLGIAVGADKFANGLFANGGMPSGALEVTGKLSQEAAERLKESWGSAHTGRKVGGTAVLEEGTQYKPISYAPEVLQFLQTRKFSVIEMARFLRIPPTKLYDTENSTYNNIEHSNLEVAVDTLDAWARNFESESDRKLLNNRYGGKRTEMDLYAVFRGDMDTRSQYFSRMMQDAAMTPNEIRMKEGLPKYKDGDRFYIASNNFTPVDKMDEVLDSQINKNLTPTTPNEKTPKEEEVDKAVVDYLKKRS